MSRNRRECSEANRFEWIARDAHIGSALEDLPVPMRTAPAMMLGSLMVRTRRVARRLVGRDRIEIIQRDRAVVRPMCGDRFIGKGRSESPNTPRQASAQAGRFRTR
jgi:hypothetical protein